MTCNDSSKGIVFFPSLMSSSFFLLAPLLPLALYPHPIQSSSPSTHSRHTMPNLLPTTLVPTPPLTSTQTPLLLQSTHNGYPSRSKILKPPKTFLTSISTTTLSILLSKRFTRSSFFTKLIFKFFCLYMPLAQLLQEQIFLVISLLIQLLQKQIVVQDSGNLEFFFLIASLHGSK